MMYELSDEEKRRIREEEEAAAERERYRTFVRQQVQGTPAAASSPQAPKVEYFIPWGRVLAFTIVVVIGIILIGQYSTLIGQRDSSAEAAKRPQGAGSSNPIRQPVTRIRREPHLVPIVEQQAFVKAGSYVWYTIKVDEGMESPKLIGRFVARGGSGNDVEVIVAEPVDFQNWANGHAASVVWSSPGKVTAGDFDVRLRPGTFNLGLSNKFSAFSDKYVNVEAKLFYETVTTVVE